MVCHWHSSRAGIVKDGRGWKYGPVKDSDECTHLAHHGEKCDGKKKDCPDLAEVEII